MKPLLLALTALTLSVPGFAAEPIVGTGIDANTFIVGHPASPTWKRVLANGEHPAVIQARLARHSTVDPNTFLVQPPAHAEWTQPAADATRVAQATAPQR